MRTALPLAVGLSGIRHGLGAIIRGVAPEHQAKYSGATFRCLDGSGVGLAASAVNDESCDCPDGSDEPGTGACAGKESTLFFCANDGSSPRQLYASRVGDGICDCCDGSDEASLAARYPGSACPNVCAEQGRLEREAAEKRAAWLRQALTVKADVVRAAQVEQQARRSELETLKQALPALEKTHEEAKKAADVIREKQAAEKAAKDAADKAVKDAKDEADKVAKDAKDAKDEADKKAAVEAEAAKAATASGSSGGAEGAAAPKGEAEKPQVSEYAKWMDGAEEKKAGAEAGADAAAEKKPEVSEYTKWMDGAEAAMEGEEADDDEEAAAGVDAAAAEGSEAGVASQATAASAPAEIPELAAEKEARTALDANEAKSTEIEKKLALFDDDHMGYASLEGKTVEKKVGEFMYKLNFFQRASQDHTSLGSWKGWSGKNIATFENGQHCWQGPARSLTIKFECGLEAEIIDVIEPSRCVYEATVEHPGACDDRELEGDVLGGQKKILHPKEEL
eukprot:TRINITY_DN17521_c0_g1_i1.p1 TRINITY_DN17521_c0_g1~~TRINITY_DN17521_c0_g1_i1.p1  ORF type:complete len:509 (-),score=187.18 TRINITY_DN17521_c0_g1_i1:58-1584(-)